jgi:hypothetical protein
MGGKPNKGTPKDKRLKRNQPKKKSAGINAPPAQAKGKGGK